MNYKKSYKVSDEVLDKIIAAAYGKASVFEKIRIKRMIEKDAELKKIFDEYKSTAELVHQIELEEFEKEILIKESDQREKNSIIEEMYSI